MNKILKVFALLMLAAPQLHAQQRHTPFNGQLLDISGSPIKNARVYVSSPRAYCPTDKDGKFGLTDVQPSDTLRILLKKRLYNVPVDGRHSLVIRLGDEKNILAEQDQQLIDIGYGHIRRRECTNAAEAYVSGKELQDIGANSVLEGLMGRVPGLVIEYVDGQPHATMRGTKSLTGPSEPLYIVDGVTMPSIDNVNVFDIDYIEVMKDASIYGSQGANGAILIFRKK